MAISQLSGTVEEMMAVDEPKAFVIPSTVSVTLLIAATVSFCPVAAEDPQLCFQD